MPGDAARPPCAQEIDLMKNPIVACSVLLLAGSILISCNSSANKFETPEGQAIREKVDQSVTRLDGAISEFKKVVRIDHSRMAEEEDVFTPPSIVTIFSNPEVNSSLLKINPLVGVDLPYKVLCYSEPELANASIAYTSPEFIMKRHGLSQADLSAYSDDLSSVLKSFPENAISNTDLSEVTRDFGLIVRKSEFDFNTTMDNLKRDINSQGDTEIFGEIDYQDEAKQVGVELSPTTLILFGAPAPGGKAMNKTPKIGLDAFCQKLLVYQTGNEVFIAYNDILDFSELYYQKSTFPQRIVNYRLNSVFKESISQ
jgi:uncharacterized protein (DUF302 family)